MSLKIIYGLSSSGKTFECVEIIKNIIKNTNDKVVYIVPEQYSFKSEVMISSVFSKSAMDRVEVLNFNRMAQRVFSTVGPVVSDFIDDDTKLMIIEKVLIKIGSKLSYFTNTYDSVGFAGVILQYIKTFKKNCIDVDKLKSIVEETNNNLLKFKLYDMILIMEEYNSYFKDNYYDSDDNMILLAEKIKKYKLYENTHVVFDNFTDFSVQQYNIIKILMQQSRDVIVTLTADSLEYKNIFDVFYKSKLTAKKLYEIAYETNTEVMPNTYMGESFSKSKEIDILKNGYFKYNNEIYSKPTEDVVICLGKDYYSETEQVAGEIKRIVREENYRYKDISVITRSPDIYYPIIKDVFERFDIFHCISETKPASKSFLYPWMISIFEIVASNYSFDSVFAFVYSGLCSIKQSDKYLLENYVIEVGNTADLWKNGRDIKYKGSFSDKEFKIICDALYYVRACIASFTDKVKGRKSVSDIIEAYASFMSFVDAERLIKNIVLDCRKNNKLQLENEIIKTYNCIIKAVDDMQHYFGDTAITFEKFIRILKSGIVNVPVNEIPSGVDDVTVTTIDRFQAFSSKIVFVVGLNEGSLPCGYINEGLFNDNELCELGIDFDVVSGHCDENYLIYRMFSSAEERIYLSYSFCNNECDALTPSQVITKTASLFSDIKKLQNVYNSLDCLKEVEGVIPTFNKVIENKSIGFWNEVALWYKEHRPDLYSIIENADSYTNLPNMLSNANIKSLYGNVINSSISRIEKYNNCAFSYFIRYGLNVDERKEYTISVADYGTYMHKIIEDYSNYANEKGWENIDEEECESISKSITMSVLKENLSDFYTESERYKHQFDKISDIMKTVLWNITGYYRNSEYISLGNEIVFDENGDFEPITITLSDGTVANLRGKIDRVDVRKTSRGDFVSVIDYKSSAKDIAFEKIILGLQIQLPVYIDAVCRNLKKNGNNVIPASMLYYHIDSPIIKGDKDMDDKKIVAEIIKALKMKGIVLEGADMPSVYVAKKTVNTNQIDRLCRYANSMVTKTLENIIKGDISVNPVRNGNRNACEYCPYISICGFNTEYKDNKYRDYKNYKIEEFFDYVDKMER